MIDVSLDKDMQVLLFQLNEMLTDLLEDTEEQAMYGSGHDPIKRAKVVDFATQLIHDKVQADDKLNEAETNSDKLSRRIDEMTDNLEIVRNQRNELRKKNREAYDTLIKAQAALESTWE